MSCCPLMGSLVLIGLALLGLLMPDMVWDWQEWVNSSRGLVSERTPQWETMNRRGSIALLILGILVAIGAIAGVIR